MFYEEPTLRQRLGRTMKRTATRLGDGGRGYEKQNTGLEKIGKVEIVDDILPKPEDLIFKKDTD